MFSKREQKILYGGVGTENNHVNKYAYGAVGTAYNRNGYGGMAYYSSETCGYINESLITTDCRSNYDESDVKYVVDNWANAVYNNDELKILDGYSARLLTVNELITLGCTTNICSNSTYSNLIYGNIFTYHLINPSIFDIRYVSYMNNSGSIGTYYVVGTYQVRPVINVYKSTLESNNNNNNND